MRSLFFIHFFEFDVSINFFEKSSKILTIFGYISFTHDFDLSYILICDYIIS